MGIDSDCLASERPAPCISPYSVQNRAMQECTGFSGLLPSAVEVVQINGDGGRPLPAWSEEVACVEGAVPRRQIEFVTTRECARRALQRLGLPPGPIPVGTHREPVWPPGIVGSLTHGANLHAAAVALKRQYRAVGIDVEPNTSLPKGTLDLIASTAERLALASLETSWPTVAWDRLLFSAKEAMFKAWFPLTGQWLDYQERVLSIDPVTGTFTGCLPLDSEARSRFRISSIDGRWGISEDRVLTAVALEQQVSQ
ncbi:4'-phosphopantetheinyl transferase family protein [Brevibacterium casei]|uniref:4'-phosphopantetheinyl transferase n=1 Tax=Brevibacterium casei TaxID=33889 RepID=A0A269Z6Y0_9MICO|nr:4'-phosphopantetheinyl transferase superfamily protein [Brevibacterium casei]PAK93548.1 hypothetical protein B8X04_15390 [Brevibacterium casei]